jgi:hypothetical protein
LGIVRIKKKRKHERIKNLQPLLTHLEVQAHFFLMRLLLPKIMRLRRRRRRTTTTTRIWKN